MSESTSRQYNEDEVNRIIRHALRLEQEDMISHEDLIETARGIGLDPRIVEAAIEQEQLETKKKRIRQARLKRRKPGFQSHLWSYLIVNAALLLINKFTPGPWWFQWSVLGWGIGLAFHFKATYFPRSERYGKGTKVRSRKTGFAMCHAKRFHSSC
jgi:hypothetical protein